MTNGTTTSLPANTSLEKIKEIFKNDRFATEACGASIRTAKQGHAICEMEISPRHFNARGTVMGGAIFTLADYALAVACNVGEDPTVSISNTIEYFNTAKGNTLIAECTSDKSGRNLGFYTVNVTDDQGTFVAKMTATCFRKAREERSQ